jgi:uncharacterized linocin/CFP29 family protein
MPDDPRLPWTDEQWATMQRIVQDSARKARVANSFLPLVGPLPPGQASVPSLRLDELTLPQQLPGDAPRRLEIDDGETRKLTTIACEVYLRTQQAEDPELASAKQMLGRAADIIGRLEDAIVFNGLTQPDEPPKMGDKLAVKPEVYTVRGPVQAGLLDPDDLKCTKSVQNLAEGGGFLVNAVTSGIQKLERLGHYGPFACVLGHRLYEAANTPNTGSLVLPSDRIVPFLDGGPLRRSSVVPPHQGVIVALAGSPIDLVVACDVHLKYLQLSLEPRYVLRVSERFVLRMKQPTARCLLDAG